MGPPNKGHFGDNINSDVLSFVETNFCRKELCLYLGGSTIGGSTVVMQCTHLYVYTVYVHC